MDRQKGRLVVRGDNHTEPINCTEVWLPVACQATLRTLLAVAATDGFYLLLLDIEKAFLNAEL